MKDFRRLPVNVRQAMIDGDGRALSAMGRMGAKKRARRRSKAITQEKVTRAIERARRQPIPFTELGDMPPDGKSLAANDRD